MDSNSFQEVKAKLDAGGSEAGFAFLVERFRNEKNYPLVFEARLMKKRHDLGLPLILTQGMDDLPAETREAYEQTTIEAAREVGGLFLAEGDIQHAWPYYRAIGEVAPIAEAIEAIEPKEGDEDLDGAIAIAFHERVNPRKGFELILRQHGICRAITSFGQYPSPEGREESALLLTRTLHGDVAESLKRTIARQEGEAPDTTSIPELIEGREWLFEGNTYYTDSSHVASVVQQSIQLESVETLKLALELTEYGKHLASMFQFKGEPPFENIYEDHGAYLRALLGEDVDEAIAHFRKKIAESDPALVGTAPAETLVNLLCRLNRHGEAVQVFREHLTDADANYLRCPNFLQLCQIAGDFHSLKQMAQERGDLLSFTAATLQG